MTGGISLTGSVRTCKIDPAYASKIQSDRFLNSNNLICPTWHGFENAGRQAHPYTFNSKTAGCNSSEDRVFIENIQRPQYVEYVNLNNNGIEGDLGGKNVDYTQTQWSQMKRNETLYGNPQANYGVQYASHLHPNCGLYQYAKGMQANSELNRQAAFIKHASTNDKFRNMAGNGQC
jgi:hypothetical protein